MKRLFAAALISAAIFFSLSETTMAQNTRTFSLINGDMIAPAVPSVDPTGATAYFGGLVAGQAIAATPSTFTLSITFRSTGVIDPVTGIYSGLIVSPYSSFVVTQSSGRKSVSTSGTIDSGNVTYRITANGLAEIVSASGNLTVWEGKNKSRRAVGFGTLEYGTIAEGAGTIALY